MDKLPKLGYQSFQPSPSFCGYAKISAMTTKIQSPIMYIKQDG